MNLRVFKYRGLENPYGLDAKSTVWIMEEDWDVLLKDYPVYREERTSVNVKIESKEDILNRYSIYAKLVKLPSGSLYANVGNGMIWIPEELLPLYAFVENKKSKVEITVLNNLDSFPVVESITLKLKESEVERWSESEFVVAERRYRKNHRYCYPGQRVFFNPASKDVVIAEVQINSANYEAELYQITEDTSIILDGKPVDLQQTIDFSQIGGLSKIIKELREIIQLPMTFPEYFSRFEIKPPKGILLYGPPGNGKTMIARALSKSLGASFIEIDLSDALQKYKGVGEHNLAKKFEEAERKRNAVIFIDEIDAIASIREKDSAGHEVSLVGKLLSLMDGIKSNSRVFVIGATNRLYAIDPALRRPGRFDKELEVPLPDKDARYDILMKYVGLGEKQVYDTTITSEYLKALADRLDGYSGADISALYREATMSAIRRQLVIDDVTGKATMLKSVDAITMAQEDFEYAVTVITATSKRCVDQQA